eukprot:2741966-Amphidinium_carterae.1
MCTYRKTKKEKNNADGTIEKGGTKLLRGREAIVEIWKEIEKKNTKTLKLNDVQDLTTFLWLVQRLPLQTHSS